MSEVITAKGFIKATIKYQDRVEELVFKNLVLNSGKEVLANNLLETDSKPFVKNIIFGDGGSVNGTPKEVQPTQEGVNGVVRIKKSVVAQLDPENPTQAMFTVVLNENEGNDFVLNEMGLELSNGKLYSLSTFADLNKTAQMEITWDWYVYYV
jgi:hypothetical protein